MNNQMDENDVPCRVSFEEKIHDKPAHGPYLFSEAEIEEKREEMYSKSLGDFEEFCDAMCPSEYNNYELGILSELHKSLVSGDWSDAGFHLYLIIQSAMRPTREEADHELEREAMEREE